MSREMTMHDRAHGCIDAVLDALARQAKREPILTESTFGDFLQGIEAMNGLGGLRSVLICHYLDNRPSVEDANSTERQRSNEQPPQRSE